MPALLSGVLIGSLLFSAGTVLAKDGGGAGMQMQGSRAGFSQQDGRGQAELPGPNGEERPFRGGKCGLPGMEQLVSEGVLTQEQSDQIQIYCQAQAEERKAQRESERDQIAAMTEAERRAYFEQNRGERPDLLAELVTAGIISQELADQIKAEMPQPPQGPPADRAPIN